MTLHRADISDSHSTRDEEADISDSHSTRDEESDISYSHSAMDVERAENTGRGVNRKYW